MKYLLAFCIVFPVFAADNTIYIEQTGSNNTFAITQEGTGHSVSITTGTVSDVDYSYFTVTQQGSGSKTASITVPSGINNSINISQDGTGSHTASILNLNGSGNQLSISQSGAGNQITLGQFAQIVTCSTITSCGTTIARCLCPFLRALRHAFFSLFCNLHVMFFHFCFFMCFPLLMSHWL